jgi:hypothetical protein
LNSYRRASFAEAALRVGGPPDLALQPRLGPPPVRGFNVGCHGVGTRPALAWQSLVLPLGPLPGEASTGPPGHGRGHAITAALWTAAAVRPDKKLLLQRFKMRRSPARQGLGQPAQPAGGPGPDPAAPAISRPPQYCGYNCLQRWCRPAPPTTGHQQAGSSSLHSTPLQRPRAAAGRASRFRRAGG